ncbi:MAG: purine-nucleoside phosphorylase [Hymenobacteraceae bacterium]|nr:purine-nucleoside phosphorylase [Hymenobacteraceae bacterium]
MDEITRIHAAADFLRTAIGDFRPRTGLILGTGLGALADEVAAAFVIPYASIPHFPLSTAPGHAGRLVLGHLGGQPVAVLQGRFHYYEGYSVAEVVRPVRVLKLLGIERLLISNAAGGLNPAFGRGDVMLVTDHLNLLPTNPLIGPNLAQLGPRFPDMFAAYDPALLARARQAATAPGAVGLADLADLAGRLREGVYAAVPGPMLETPAEYRYLRLIGADAVGMSTVPEVIAAAHMAVPTLAVSVITDLCDPARLRPVALPEILAAAAEAEPRLTALLKSICD